MAELLCSAGGSPPLELSLARDRQPVDRISVKLNKERGNSKARRSHLVKLWDPMIGSRWLGVAGRFPRRLNLY